MLEREEIDSFVIKSLAGILKVEPDSLSLELNLLDDLNAKSVTYFPLIAKIEDEYDLEIDYQVFRTNCRTIGSITDFVIAES